MCNVIFSPPETKSSPSIVQPSLMLMLGLNIQCLILNYTTLNIQSL